MQTIFTKHTHTHIYIYKTPITRIKYNYKTPTDIYKHCKQNHKQILQNIYNVYIKRPRHI